VSEYHILYDHMSRMMGQLTAYVCRRLGCPAAEAEDLIRGLPAAVFLQRVVRQAEPIQNPEAFLWAVVERAVESAHRDRYRWKRRYVPLGPVAYTVPVHGGADDPAGLAEAADTLRFVTELLATRASPTDRAMLERVAAGVSYKEIGAEFNMTEVAARSRVFRLRAVLLEALTEQGGCR
jgi:DNA-directed RNA polymerase specialized sigma24 family protein